MINFIKNLFKSKFIPKDEIQEYLVTIGFKQSTSNNVTLVKQNETHIIIYDMSDLSTHITKGDSTIVLKSFGNLNRIKRFISKYSI